MKLEMTVGKPGWQQPETFEVCLKAGSSSKHLGGG